MAKVISFGSRSVFRRCPAWTKQSSAFACMRPFSTNLSSFQALPSSFSSSSSRTFSSGARAISRVVTNAATRGGGGLARGAGRVCKRTRAQPRRFTTVDSPQTGRWAKLKQRFTKEKIKSYLIVGGMIVGVYIVVKTGFSIVHFLSSTSFYDVGYVAYIAGFLSAGVVMAIFFTGSRGFVLRPEPVFAEVSKRVSKNDKIMAFLSTNKRLDVGKFRAYTFLEGGLRLRKDPGEDVGGWDAWWRPRRMQLMFQVNSEGELAEDGAEEGAEGETDADQKAVAAEKKPLVGMISTEVQRSMDGTLVYNMLAVDNLTTGKKLVVQGSADVEVYQGISRLR